MRLLAGRHNEALWHHRLLAVILGLILLSSKLAPGCLFIVFASHVLQNVASKVLSVRQVISLMEVDCAKVRRAGEGAAHHVARAEENVVDEDDAVGSEALPRDGHAAVAARAAPQRLQRSVAHLGQKLYPVLAHRPRQPPCNTASGVGLVPIDGNIGLASVAMDSQLSVLLPLTVLLTIVSSA